MRRKDREVTSFGEMLRIVGACDVCRLGLQDEGVPYIVPLNFGHEVREGKLILYLHGAPQGKKVDLIRRNEGKVSFEMDTDHRLVEGDIPCAYSYLYQSVIGYGQIDFPEDPDEKRHGLGLILKQYTGSGAGASGMPHEAAMQEEVVARTCVMRLTVHEWTCKRH